MKILLASIPATGHSSPILVTARMLKDGDNIARLLDAKKHFDQDAIFTSATPTSFRTIGQRSTAGVKWNGLCSSTILMRSRCIPPDQDVPWENFVRQK